MDSCACPSPGDRHMCVIGASPARAAPATYRAAACIVQPGLQNQHSLRPLLSFLLVCQGSIYGQGPGTRKGCHYISTCHIKIDGLLRCRVMKKKALPVSYLLIMPQKLLAGNVPISFISLYN